MITSYEIVLRQEEFGVGIRLEQFLDRTIRVDTLHGIAGRFLGLNAVRIGDVVAAEAGVRARVLGV